MPISPLEVVRECDRAFDARDVEQMLALAHEDCEIVTLHQGTLHGHEVLRAFMSRQTYGVTPVIEQRRYFARDDTVVTFMRAEWRYVESGEAAGREERAAVYAVRDGRVARFEIHPDLPAALASGGLTEDDEAAER
jgi:hypothetical protein